MWTMQTDKNPSVQTVPHFSLQLLCVTGNVREQCKMAAAELKTGSFLGKSIYSGTFRDQDVVVKEVANEFRCSENQLRQLLNLDSQNVVKYLHYVSEASDSSWKLVCEKCDTCLVDFIRNEMAHLELAFAIYQIALGLDYLHSKDIVHGSLKPGNVMIWKQSPKSMRFVLKLTDYGLRTKSKYEDPFLDYAKADDVHDLGLVSCFVASGGTRTDVNETHPADLTAVKETRRILAMQFIRLLTDSDPESRPDVNVVIFQPFLFLSCHEARQKFVSFCSSHADKSEVLRTIDEHVEKWRPDEINCHLVNEEAGRLQDSVDQIRTTKLTDSQTLAALVESANRTIPHLFSNFVWNCLCLLTAKPKVKLKGDISRGGFSFVYKARWKLNGEARTIAVKRMLDLEDPEMARIFRREVDNLKQLDSPFVVKYLGERSVQSPKTSFIFLELCDGNLAELIKGQLPNVPKSAIADKEIVCQTILGLGYLHGKGIIHQDLKPRNILLLKRGVCVLVKLTDFGQSKQLREGQSSFSYTTNPGTFGFIAPELLDQHGHRQLKPTFASDIWALGVLIFFVLSRGQHPFGPINSLTNCFIRTMKSVPNLKALDSNWLAADLVLRLLGHQPETRPNIFLLMSHPYFTVDSEPMTNLVCFNLCKYFSLNVDVAMTAFDGHKVADWFEKQEENLTRQHDTENLDEWARHSGTSDSDGTILQRKILEEMCKDLPLADIKSFEFGTGNFCTREKLLREKWRLFPVYVWSLVAETATDLQTSKQYFQITDVEYALLDEHSKLSQLLIVQQSPWNQMTKIDSTSLLAALFCKRLHLTDVVLRMCKNVNAKFYDGSTPLHCAAKWNSNIEVIQLLIDLGADIKATDSSGATPLHWAAETNPNIEVIKLLTDRGADIQAKNSNGETPLHRAVAFNSNVQVIQLLLDVFKQKSSHT